MNRVQLQQLVIDFKSECGLSNRGNVGIDEDMAIKSLLRRQQELLYQMHDWPHLRTFAQVPLYAGQRYYNRPVQLDGTRIERVTTLSAGGAVRDAERGIDFEQYAVCNSDTDARGEGPFRWDFRAVLDGAEWVDMLEVWPIPASDGNTLAFKGLRPLRQLVSDTDTTDLDGTLIVLFAAAKRLARQESKDAREAAAAAQTHLANLKAAWSTTTHTATMLGGPVAPRGITIRALR